jgi:hypothetical protein
MYVSPSACAGLVWDGIGRVVLTSITRPASNVAQTNDKTIFKIRAQHVLWMLAASRCT